MAGQLFYTQRAIALILFLALLPVVAAEVSLPETVIAGETFTLSQTNAQNTFLRISNENTTYRYNGAAENIRITLNSPGLYDVLQYNRGSGQVVSAQPLLVLPNPILTPETIFVGEEFSINFSLQEHTYDLRIEGNGKTFKPLDDFSSSITLSLNEPGTYTVKLSDLTTVTSYEKTFLVLPQKNLKEKLEERFSLDFTVVGRNVIARGNGVNRLEISHLHDDGVSRLEFLPSQSRFATDIVVVENVSIDSATVRLAKTGIVDHIVRCDEFVNDSCSSWIKTNIPFVDHGSYIEFTVDHFSAYAGVGVASINTKKSIYRPGEVAELIAVVLDGEGYLVGSANVEITVTDPFNNSNYYNTTSGTVVETSNGVYETTHNTTAEGEYIIHVHAAQPNVEMYSSFAVLSAFDFDIIRDAPVTIDPWLGMFESSVRIISYNNFSSFTFTEYLPANFTITNNGGGTESIDGEYKTLSWDVTNNTVVSYSVQAPLVTPDLYSLGQSVVNYGNNTFIEARPWYVAIDPTATMTVASCVQGDTTACSGTEVTNINTNDTNLGLTVDGAGGGETGSAIFNNPSGPVAGATINTVTLRMRHNCDASCAGDWTLTFENATSGADYCTATVTLPDNVDTNSASTPASCSWTLDRLNDLRVLFHNGDAQGGDVGYIGYLDIFVDYTNPNAKADWTNDLVVNNSVVNVGEIVRFNATANDPEGDQYYLTVCDSDSITDGAPGTCDGNTVCTSAVTNDDAEASCTNTTVENMEGTNTYYGFICDAGSSTCNTSTSTSLTVIGVTPSVAQVNITPNPGVEGATITVNTSVTSTGTIDTVVLQVYYPNSTLYYNTSMTNVSDIYTGTFTAEFTPAGNYTVTVWANETEAGASSTNSTEFVPYRTASNFTTINVDGSFSDWNGVTSFDDALNDAIAGGIDNLDWAALTPSDPPSGRSRTRGTFDKNLNTVLLHGGFTASSSCDNSGTAYCNGTYAYNGTDNTWYNLDPSTPPGDERSFNTLTWDENSQTTIMFGGQNGGSCDGGSDYCSNMYAYNGTSNSWSNLSPSNIPTERYGNMMVFDPTLNLVLMFGGTAPSCDGGDNLCEQTYAYNGTNNSWSALNPSSSPSGRAGNAMVFDQVLNQTISFGGEINTGSCDGSGSVYCNGTWAYNASDNNWYELNPTNKPDARVAPAMIFDENLGATVMFGGQGVSGCDDSTNTMCNGTWAYNVSGNTWYLLELENPPSGRIGMTAAFDENIGKTVIFGGAVESGTCDGSSSIHCNGTYIINYTSTTSLDYTNVSVANNDTNIFILFGTNNSIADGTSNFYRAYLDTSSSTGNTTTPENNNLPLSYNYILEYNNGACNIYNQTYTDIGNCNYSYANNQLEIGANYSLLGLTTGDTINLTWETTIDNTQSDIMPEPDSFVQYTIAASGISDSGPPVISNVTSISPVTPLVNQNVTISLNFTATDPDGSDTLVNASAFFTVNNSATRNGTCSPNTLNSTHNWYNCSVQLTHYDIDGSWDINVSVVGGTDRSHNDTTTFTYNTLTSISVTPSSFDFGSLTLGATTAASSNPLTIDNQGNQPITGVNVTAYTLVNDSNFIGIGNFTVNISDAVGTMLVNATEVTAVGSTIPIDTDAGELSELLYFYISTPIDQANGAYTSQTSWVITGYE